MIPARVNLCIKQGASFALTVTLLQGVALKTSTDTAANAETIALKSPVEPTLAANTRLLFGSSTRVQLSQQAEPGAMSLAIVAQPFPIVKNTTGRVLLNLSGCTLRAQIKTVKGKLLGTFTTAIADPVSGNGLLTLTNEQTMLIPANIPLGLAFSQSDLEQREMQSGDYVWDLEIVYPDGRVESPMSGLVVVLPEVTT